MSKPRARDDGSFGSAGSLIYSGLVSWEEPDTDTVNYPTTEGDEGGQVCIGPAYLVLWQYAAHDPLYVMDSNGDGIPDFIADRNGNGIEDSDEIPWISQNTAIQPQILSPPNNTTVSGIVEVMVNPGPYASSITEVQPEVDGAVLSGSLNVSSPTNCYAVIEIDTRQLEDGPHSLVVETFDSTPPAEYAGPNEVQSTAVTFQTANSFRFPEWDSMEEGTFNAELEVPPSSSANLYIFDDTYPKSYVYYPLGPITVDASSGTIDWGDTTDDLGIPSTTTQMYSAVELGSAVELDSGGRPQPTSTRIK